MKRYSMIAVIALALLFGITAYAQNDSYELTGYIVVSGATLSGGAYTVDGAVGQPDAGTLNGGGYSLGGGFFGGGVTAGSGRGNLYIPLVQR